MKIFSVDNNWNDMGYVTGICLVGTILWHWTHIFPLILSLVLTFFMYKKSLQKINEEVLK